MNDRVLHLRTKLWNKRLCGSSKGWLIVVESDFRITLINPFCVIKGKRTMENSIVHLPPIPIKGWTGENTTASECEYSIFKATISADPVLNPNKCTVAAIYEDMCQLAFFRLGKDKTWNYVDHRYTLIEEVVFVEDKLFAVDDWSRLLCIDAATSSSVNVVPDPMKRPNHLVKKYLVALNEREFLMVVRHFGTCDLYRTTKFEVFKLDFENRKWIEKNMLGDVVLFVGDKSSMFVQASAFRGCEPDYIYYTYDNVHIFTSVGTAGPVDYGVYNVKTKRLLKPHGKFAESLIKNVEQRLLKPYGKFAESLIKNAEQPPIWMSPNLLEL